MLLYRLMIQNNAVDLKDKVISIIASLNIEYLNHKDFIDVGIGFKAHSWAITKSESLRLLIKIEAIDSRSSTLSIIEKTSMMQFHPNHIDTDQTNILDSLIREIYEGVKNAILTPKFNSYLLFFLISLAAISICSIPILVKLVIVNEYPGFILLSPIIAGLPNLYCAFDLKKRLQLGIISRRNLETMLIYIPIISTISYYKAIMRAEDQVRGHSGQKPEGSHLDIRH